MYAVNDLPKFSERRFTARISQLPLYFGTSMYAFEGVNLVLPLKNIMRSPEDFSKRLGVLNVGMVVASTINIVMGGIGYWKYGEDTQAFLTLNLPDDAM